MCKTCNSVASWYSKTSYLNVSSLPLTSSHLVVLILLFSHLSLGRSFLIDYILLSTQSLSLSWQGPDHPPILRESLRSRYRSLEDVLWGRALPELPHGAARALGPTQWPKELSFSEVQGSILHHWFIWNMGQRPHTVSLVNHK